VDSLKYLFLGSVACVPLESLKNSSLLFAVEIPSHLLLSNSGNHLSIASTVDLASRAILPSQSFFYALLLPRTAVRRVGHWDESC